MREWEILSQNQNHFSYHSSLILSYHFSYHSVERTRAYGQHAGPNRDRSDCDGIDLYKNTDTSHRNTFLLLFFDFAKSPQSFSASSNFRSQKIAHLSRPWSNGWVALSFLFGRLSRYGDISSTSTSTCPRPPNPYIFWKLMIKAIQKWQRNTNTKTKTITKTKTKTKTKTPRE